MTKSFFIVVEGLDGTGKSSVVRRIASMLNASEGLPGHVKLTFEPHDPSACGVYIRQVLTHRIKAPLHTLALAFAVNRSDHCIRDIGPFLRQSNGRGRVVICDRYTLSSLVYQSDENFPMARVMELNESAIKPDLTIFLDASNKTCYARMRSRDQSKELFETNLKLTRQKYQDAMDFLSDAGDKICVVSAEGSLSDVCLRVLESIRGEAPEWLSKAVHSRLFVDDQPEYFIENEQSLIKTAQDLRHIWETGILVGKQDILDRLHLIEEAVNSLVSRMGVNEYANLFLDLAKTQGYSVIGKLPWMDIDALELAVSLPLGIPQRGAVILLGNTQRYDAILPNILGSDKIETLRAMSDFLFILDSNPASLHGQYFERELLKYKNGRDASPSIAVFGRRDMVSAIISLASQEFYSEFLQSISCINGGKELMAHWIENVASGQLFHTASS